MQHLEYLLHHRGCMLSCVRLLVTPWTLARQARIFQARDFPGKNTGEGCHFLLQGIFPTHGLNLCLLPLMHWEMGSLQLSHLGTSLN